MNNSERKIIYLAGFLFSLAIALMSYLNSSYLAGFVSPRTVSIAYTAGSILAIAFLLFAPTLWRKFGGYKFLISVIILDALAILFFALAGSAISAFIFFIIGFALNLLIYFSLDELLKIFSPDSHHIGGTRGVYLALSSLAWVVAQLSLGAFLGALEFRLVYLVSFAVMLVLFAVSATTLRGLKDPVYDKLSPHKYLKEFFQNRTLLRAYSLIFLLQFFYAWMVIYTPIYLSLHLGFSWQQIGLIFSFMLVPFFLIPVPLGRHADKVGEKNILMLGFTITAVATFCLFFLGPANGLQSLVIWALALFATRVGATAIEVGCDSYFFKHVKPENDEYISIYRSAFPVAFIIGPLFAFTTLLFIPSFAFLFPILSGITLLGLIIATKVPSEIPSQLPDSA